MFEIKDKVGPSEFLGYETEQVEGNSNRLRLRPGSGGDETGSGGREGDPGAVNLLPSPAVLDKTA